MRQFLSTVPCSRLDAKREWGFPPRPRCIAIPCSQQLPRSLFNLDPKLV
ncbi:MAG: hypothetical protein F6K26_06555 [Moorea sp. SIO2I5]|nr:hypothetical protein [Moorena sp. SIO2I5]